MYLPEGAFAPVPTPLDPGGAFDARALGLHLGWLKSEGLDGALVLGTNGEFPSFSLVERIQVAEAAAAADSGLSLLLNVGGCALPEVLALADRAALAGAHLRPAPGRETLLPATRVLTFLVPLLATTTAVLRLGLG